MPMPSPEQVLDSMRGIIDPDLGRDIVSLGFIKELQIEDGEVRFTLELTTPGCPVKEKFREQCQQAVGALEGVDSVQVTLSAMQPKHRQQEGPRINTLDRVDALVAVSSCKGGVGKSTVAAHLARAMQREGLRVGLLDADVYGPSVPTLFNVHMPGIAVHNNLITPVDVDGLKVMSLGFLLGESPAVLRGPIVSNYISQVLRQTDWGDLDYLIIDLPPGTGDIQLTIVQQAALDGAIIVTTPQALSLVDVSRGILMFEKVNVPVLGVVENMCSFTCGECGAVHYPFGRSQGKLQQRFGLPTLAELPITEGVSDLASHDAGADIEAFATLSDQTHRAIGKSRKEAPAQHEVDVQQGFVRIQWADGHEAAFDNHALRCACPCALCVDENTGEQILVPAEVPQDISIDGVQRLGNYAVAFQWSDGHSTGIYAWDYLRELSKRGELAAK